MQADYAVELGPDDEVLEVPWSAPEQELQYYDLKRHPDLLSRVEEARRFPELGEFLAAANSPASIVQTAKCDVWSSTDINPEEEIFAAAVKFGSYIDLIFNEPRQRFSLADHEKLAHGVSSLLKHAPEIPASVEFLIRRCHYHDGDNPTEDNPTEVNSTEDGFYLTFYLFGYADNDELARRQWAIGLKLAENAILQLSLA